MMDNKRCNDCSYFGHDENTRQNVCKFYAPVASGGMMSDPITMWPVVDPDDWCGQFKGELQ